MRASNESNLREESVDTRAALVVLFCDLEELPASSFLFKRSSYVAGAADDDVVEEVRELLADLDLSPSLAFA